MTTEETCPDCGGEGSIEYTNGPLARCGRCSGSGATRSPAPNEQGEGPSLPADQVAVNREEKECPDWSDAEIRAAVAAFRATEERS